ncbi:unnamed protein product [Closterium sp. NIES-54]
MILEQLPATVRHEIPGLPLCVAAPPVRLFQAQQRQLAVGELQALRRLARDDATLARFTSLHGPGAGAWVSAVPAHSYLTFTAAEWGIAAAIRLGLPIQQLQVAGRCVCGTAYIDPADPHHALRCKHQHGPSRVHDEVKFAVAKISKASGGVVTMEDSVVLQGKRVDVAVRQPMAGEAHALEISVADPLSLSPSLLGQCGRQIGVAAREWEHLDSEQMGETDGSKKRQGGESDHPAAMIHPGNPDAGNQESKDHPKLPDGGKPLLLEERMVGDSPVAVSETPRGETEATEKDEKVDEEEEKKGKKKEKKPAVPYWRLFSYADRTDVALMAVGTFGAVLHGAALPISFLFLGKMVDSFGTNDLSGVNTFVLAMVYIALCCLVGGWLEVACWMDTGERQSARVRRLYLQALLRQEVAFFDLEACSGELVNRVSSDVLLLQDAISEKVGNCIHYFSTFVCGFIVGFTSVWQLALVILAVCPLIIATGGIYAAVLTGLMTQGEKAYTEAGKIAEQAVGQVRTVQSYVAEDRTVEAYGRALRDTFKLGVKGGLAKGVGLGAIYALMFASFALMFWFSGILISQGIGNGGSILTTMFAIALGSMGLGQALPNVTAFSKGRVAAHKIFVTIARRPVIGGEEEGEGGSGGKELEAVEGRVEFEMVCFAYPARPEVPIFEDFSLSIPAGATVALVGPSGSGKSTVVALIQRFYDPTAGSVSLDGADLRQLSLTWLRSQLGLVSQEPSLFATSILENIRYGKEDATLEEVEEAARIANAHSFVTALPQGYNTQRWKREGRAAVRRAEAAHRHRHRSTVDALSILHFIPAYLAPVKICMQVGERGVQLSGGQKQRIAIARAVVRNPRVLLLDEATSALDSESELVVQAALDSGLMRGRSTVVIAHRLSTIRNADKIAVVAGGRVVEEGTHEELMAHGGLEEGGGGGEDEGRGVGSAKEGARKEGGVYANLVRLQMVPGLKAAGRLRIDVDQSGYEEDVGRKISRALSSISASSTPRDFREPTADVDQLGSIENVGRKLSRTLSSLSAASTPDGFREPAADVEFDLDLMGSDEDEEEEEGGEGGGGKRVWGELRKVLPAPLRALFPGGKKRGEDKGGNSQEGKESGVEEEGAKGDGEGEGEGEGEGVGGKKASWWRLARMSAPEWPFTALGAAGAVMAGAFNPVYALLLIDVSGSVVWVGVVFSAGAVIAAAFNPVYALPFIDVIAALYNPVTDEMKREVNKWAIVFTALGVLAVPVHSVQNYGFGVSGEALVKRVREKMLAAILGNEVAWFDRDANASGAIASRLATDATLVKAAVADRIALATQNLSVIVMAFVIGFVVEWRVALVTIATFPLLIFAALMEQQFLAGFAGNQNSSHAGATTIAAEAVANIRTVAAFNAQDKILALFTARLAGPLRRSFLRGQVGGAGFGLSQFFMYGSYALALWYGSTLIPNTASYGDVLKSFMVLIMTSMAIAESITLAPDIAKGSVAVRSVFKTTDRTPKIQSDDPTAEVVSTVRGKIEFRSVSFAYPTRPETPVLQDLSLRAAPGKMLALVGPSGSGKSSVVALVERFYDPTAGSVRVDGEDIRTVHLKTLRSFIGLVSQEPALFATTIRGNILYGQPGASEAEVVEAARAANVHGFISGLPEGYDTQVGERGVQLSGGQKQRIAIARAILKDPAVLLLDEATSALDAESEVAVQSALNRIMIGRTTIVVAHRLSTICHADCIAVLQGGRLVEQGTHMELIGVPNGAYATLVQLQQMNKVAM